MLIIPINTEKLDEAYYDEAIDLVIKEGKASAALLQNKLRIGFAQAARILNHLEEIGVVGPPKED